MRRGDHPCNETAQRCENCHVSKTEYGRVLFERDLAQRSLQIANFRQRQRKDRVDGADGVSIREDPTGSVHQESEQFGTIQLSPKSSRSKVQLEQQNDRSNSDTDTARTQSLVNGYTDHLSLRENGYYEDSDRNQDDNGLEDDNSYETRRKSNVHLESDMDVSSCGNNYNDNGDNDNDDDDDDDDNDRNYCTDRDVDCHRDKSSGFHCCYDDYNDGDGDDDDDDDDDDDGNRRDGDYDNGVKNDDDHDEDGAIRDDQGDLHGGGYDNSDGDDDNDDDDDDDDSHYSDAVNDGDDGDDDNDDDDDDDDSHNSDAVDDGDDDDDNDDDENDDDYNDYDDDNDDDDVDDNDADDHDNDENDDDYNDYDDNEYAQQASFLPADNDLSRKATMGIKAVFKDSSFSLPVNNNRARDDEKVIKTENILSTGGSNNTDNQSLPEVGGRPFFPSNVNIANVPVTSHSTSLSQGAKPKTLPPRLPLSNAAEPDYFYNCRIPSLEVTGINQNFLSRHTTDQSLKYTSQPDDSNIPAKSTSPTNWPAWSLPPPPAPETCDLRQQHPYSRGVHPAFVGNRATPPDDGQLWNQPNMERNYRNLTREEQRPFNYTNSWFARQEEAFDRFRISENSPGATGTQVGNSFNRQSWMPSAFESSWRNPAYNFSGSQTSSSSYGDFAARSQPLAVKSHAPVIVHPNVTTPATEQQIEPSNMLQEAPLSPGFSQHGSLAPGSTEDHTLASLERKVAEACAVVERVMRDREERTKKQREAAQREREIRERREREARETREAREREEREMREKEAREMSEREIREQRENEERGTGEGGAAGELVPVQESPRWQCEHYQRRCSVRFPCCGVFYPCHRCHNVSGACDTDDRKANHATHVKCGSCGHEEEMNEGSQYCSSCGIKMSEYFCFKCKHFTGVEKNPFHCSKCEICRIYRDKSFHCDVCNVCLDKRLEGKHKCRPDSGHDECCICLEDAFSGCQILPCSHKVHKECAIAMIQNGVRNCPICRHPLFSQDSQ